MTRVVDFSDGFVSTSAPDLVDIVSQKYEIENNQAAFVSLGITFDEAEFKSAIIEYELERVDSIDEFRQVGTISAVYDGASWNLFFGTFSGDDMLTDNALPSNESVALAINGQDLEYKSGNMGASYDGNIKLVITRFSV
jgi:hypothetical protein